jgi:hypothetical protein
MLGLFCWYCCFKHAFVVVRWWEHHRSCSNFLQAFGFALNDRVQ